MTRYLSDDPGFEVVGVVSDGRFVLDKARKLLPSVITMDLQMRQVGGVAAIKELMASFPVPVVVVSGHDEGGGRECAEAMKAGAVGCIGKHDVSSGESLDAYLKRLHTVIRRAATTFRRRRPPPRPIRLASGGSSLGVGAGSASRGQGDRVTPHAPLCAIGASTGGTVALEAILSRLPESFPAVLVTQHIPKAFSAPLARRLDLCCAMHVQEAKDGELLRSGTVYIAPGDRHLMVGRAPGGLASKLSDAPPVNRHRPSVDVMFRSLLSAGPTRVIAALLTGMGRDGAAGLHALHEAGARTLAQDEESSVVWSMPKAAIDRGAADEVLGLDAIGPRLVELLKTAA